MSANEILILKEFKTNLITFVDELIEQFPIEGDLIIFRIAVKDQYDIKDIMEIFSFYLNKDEQINKIKIKERDETYFLDTAFYDIIDKVKLLHYKKIWRSQFDNENKSIIWKWIDSFVYLSDKYTKTKLKN